MAEHGTYAAYIAHTASGSRPCAECRRAASDYQREWRQKSSKYAAQVARQKVKDRALRILGQRHPTELRTIIAEIGASDG